MCIWCYWGSGSRLSSWGEVSSVDDWAQLSTEPVSLLAPVGEWHLCPSCGASHSWDLCSYCCGKFRHIAWVCCSSTWGYIKHSQLKNFGDCPMDINRVVPLGLRMLKLFIDLCILQKKSSFKWTLVPRCLFLTQLLISLWAHPSCVSCLPLWLAKEATPFTSWVQLLLRPHISMFAAHCRLWTLTVRHLWIYLTSTHSMPLDLLLLILSTWFPIRFHMRASLSCKWTSRLCLHCVSGVQRSFLPSLCSNLLLTPTFFTLAQFLLSSEGLLRRVRSPDNCWYSASCHG